MQLLTRSYSCQVLPAVDSYSVGKFVLVFTRSCGCWPGHSTVDIQYMQLLTSSSRFWHLRIVFDTVMQLFTHSCSCWYVPVVVKFMQLFTSSCSFLRLHAVQTQILLRLVSCPVILQLSLVTQNPLCVLFIIYTLWCTCAIRSTWPRYIIWLVRLGTKKG